MKRIILLLAFVTALGCMTPAFAGSVCPDLTAGSGYASDCNLLVTFAPNGSVSFTHPTGGATPYDGSDDAMIGVVNNTNTTINALNVYGYGNGGGAFEFDLDGACSYISPDPCNHPTLGSYVSVWGDNGYWDQGSGVWFTNVTSDANATEDGGTVNFAGGIAPGGTAWWSMESAVGTGPINITPTPEPVSMVLMGTFLLGSLGFLRRR